MNIRDKEVPEIIKAFKEGRYLFGQVRGEEEVIVLARFIGSQKKIAAGPLRLVPRRSPKR